MNAQANKTPTEINEMVDNHIKSFNPSISHYQEAHAPNRLFVSPELSALKMLKNFKNFYQEARIQFNHYWKRLRAMKICFTQREEEECKVCELHSNHLTEDHNIEKFNQSIVDENNKPNNY